MIIEQMSGQCRDVYRSYSFNIQYFKQIGRYYDVKIKISPTYLQETEQLAKLKKRILKVYGNRVEREFLTS